MAQPLQFFAETSPMVAAGPLGMRVLEERVIPGRLGNIAALAREASVQPSALLLIGPSLAAASVPLTVRCAVTLTEA